MNDPLNRPEAELNVRPGRFVETQLIDLAKEKAAIVQALERLRNMRGYADNKRPKCNAIEFKTEYGAHMSTYTVHPELNILLIDTAMNYYNQRLSDIGVLLTTVEDAAGDKLAEAVRILKDRTNSND